MTQLHDAEQRVRAAGGKIVKPVFSFPRGSTVSLRGSERQRARGLV
jgi:predicted enzyme related to lactoylglutathione lyase